MFLKKVMAYHDPLPPLNPADQQRLDILRKLQTARNEIAEKIKNHGHPEEIPKLQGVLQKYEDTIAEITKTFLSQNLRSVDPAGMVYKKLPGGMFEMGDVDFKNDNPPHQVILSPFEIAETLVTQKQWRELMGNMLWAKFGPENVKAGVLDKLFRREIEFDDRPMENINWRDTVHYCIALSKKAKDVDESIKEKIKNMDPEIYNDFALQNPKAMLYRLPTEAEWEYAAKAGKNNKYGTKDGKLPNQGTAVFGRDEDQGTTSVTSTYPNAFGLHDMAGHLYQWTASWHQFDFYENGKTYTNPVGPSHGNTRVMRSASWQNNNDDLEIFKSASRGARNPNDREMLFGFRPVRYIGKDE